MAIDDTHLTQRGEAAISRANASKTERDPRWLPILAALLVMFGGIVIPIVGTIAGLVLVWFTETWTRREKWIATLAPVLVAVLLILFGTVSAVWPVHQVQSVGGDAPNPLIPVPVDLVASGVLLLLVVQFGAGTWLLARARRAWSIADAQRLPA